MPRFSIVIATYNRGEHIRPTLESLLQQSCKDFEVLIIGDCCTDDTERVLEPYLSEKIRWKNLESRCGSQSYPNNEGIALARGDLIAYLGHDDIWAPNHLSELARVFDSRGNPDFVVSGCIYHTPPGCGFRWVSGLFEETEAATHNFFPPSSYAHTAAAAMAIGKWRPPKTISVPVDNDFQSRAASLGMMFVSTRRVTVHKFAAGHRYLSYLRQSSIEQTQMLKKATRLGFQSYVDQIIEESKRANTFMILGLADPNAHEKGELFRQNAQNKGNIKPELVPFKKRATITQGNDFRGLDWHPRDSQNPEIRWSGPNPRPKILIPYCGNLVVTCQISLHHENAKVMEAVRIIHDGNILKSAFMPIAPTEGGIPGARLEFAVTLTQDDYSVLEIEQPGEAFVKPIDGTQTGVGVGNIELRLQKQSDNYLKRSLELISQLLGIKSTRTAGY